MCGSWARPGVVEATADESHLHEILHSPSADLPAQASQGANKGQVGVPRIENHALALLCRGPEVLPNGVERPLLKRLQFLPHSVDDQIGTFRSLAAQNHVIALGG